MDRSMLDLLLKDFGPIWLLGLYPLLILLLIRGTRKIRNAWGSATEEVRIAGFPKAVARDPKHCHRYFVILVVGTSLFAWVVFAGPLVAVAHNHIYDPDVNPSLGSAERMMGRILPLFITLWASFFLGLLLIIYGYSSALLRALRVSFQIQPPLAQPPRESDDKA
jgi:hypothetical protein